jgi:hypothetical protein
VLWASPVERLLITAGALVPGITQPLLLVPVEVQRMCAGLRTRSRTAWSWRVEEAVVLLITQRGEGTVGILRAPLVLRAGVLTHPAVEARPLREVPQVVIRVPRELSGLAVPQVWVAVVEGVTSGEAQATVPAAEEAPATRTAPKHHPGRE